MPILAFPSEGIGGLNAILESRFGKCESITFVSLKEKHIESVKVIPILSTDALGNRGKYIAKMIKDNNASITFIRYIGMKSFNSLKAQNIEIFQVSMDNLKINKCVDLYIQGKLSILTESNAHLIKD